MDTDYRRAGEGRQDDKKKDDRKCFKCQRTGDITRNCNGQGAKGRKDDGAEEGVTPVRDFLCEYKFTEYMYSLDYLEGVKFEDTDYSEE